MRQLLFISALLCFTAAGAQSLPVNTPITIKAGTHGYVTINNQDYMRGSLGSAYAYDSTMGDSTLALYYMRNGGVFVKPTIDSLFIYGDSSNKKAYNMNTLRAWMRSNFEYVGN